jgi:hypothetical protein
MIMTSSDANHPNRHRNLTMATMTSSEKAMKKKLTVDMKM